MTSGNATTTGRSITAGLAAAALASTLTAGPAQAAPPKPTAAKPTAATTTGATTTGATTTAAGARRVIPCPRPKVKPPAHRPPRPVPPADNPALRAVGGDALATSGLTIQSGTPTPPAVSATSWLVADLDSGEVLGGCGPHVYGTPASVQKLLLAATAMPNLNPRTKATITQGDVTIEPGSSAVGLVRGGEYSVSTLWLGLLLNSGNDAANTLARLAGGNSGVPATVAAMNAEAKRLGAFETHAVTPSGLDARGQFTSAYDLALIARACFGIHDFTRYALTKSAQLPAQKALKKGGFQIQNENKLIFNYKGALGGKTGFTTIARHSYVGAAQRNGRRLVVTLLGAETSPLHGWQQGAALLNWGFSLPRDASVGKLVEPGSVDPVGTANSKSVAVPPVTQGRRKVTPAAARTSSPRMRSLGTAALVAIVLAGAPLLLLIAQRRRHRVRRPPRTVAGRVR